MRAGRLLIAPILFLALLAGGCKANSSTNANSGAAAATGASASSGGSSGCPTSNTTAFAKSKFVLHVGLAAGTFHRYLYKPYQAGAFTSGASGRTLALVKAGTTALFDAHEVNKAIEDVHANPTLCKVLIAPLTTLAGKFTDLKSALAHGDTSGLAGVNSAVSSLSSLSAANGDPITETTDESQG